MNVLDLLEKIGIVPKLATRGKSGPEYWSPCPGCGGDDRFHVWPEARGNGSYWCRQCGKHGDDVQFRVDFMGMEYPEAFEAAGREKPVNFIKRPAPALNKPVFTPATINDPSSAWQARAAKLVAESHAALLDNPSGLAYLAGRGIALDAVKQFQLGAVAGEKGYSCRFRSRKAWGLEPIQREDGRPKALWIPRGLLIPYIIDGRVQRIRIRRPDADLKTKKDVRYYVMPGSSMGPMCISSGQRAAVVIEAELDAMAVAAAAGDLAAVVALGSSSTRPDQSCWPVLQNALRILVAMDFDQAGAKAWHWWQEQFPAARRWPVPAGKDPGDAVAVGVDLRAWIDAGLPPACRMRSLFLKGDDQKGAEIADNMETGLEKKMEYDGPDQAAGTADMDNIDRLYVLLCRYPGVRIRAVSGRTTLIRGGKIRDAVLQKISKLVFFDTDCFGFLQDHPDDVVSAGNFYLE